MSRPTTESQASSEAANVGTSPPAAFGLATATFVVVASMIGSGVLTTSGFTTLSVDSNALMLTLWVVGGVVAVCGALTLAELGGMLPHSGGDYVFLYHAFGPLAGFLSGWVSFLIGFGGPIAVAASGAARYLLMPFDLGWVDVHLAQQVLASVIIVVLGLAHAWGGTLSALVQGSTTTFKLLVLGGLAVAGLWAAPWKEAVLVDWPKPSVEVGFSALMSLVYIGYAYTGWNGAGYIAGEVRNPRRNVPLAILLGTAIVTTLYLALNLFYAAALSPADLKGSVADRTAAEQARLIAEGVPAAEAASRAEGLGREAVAPIAALAAARTFGPDIAMALSLAVGITLLASTSAFILTGPRVAYAMARAGQFPAAAGRLSKRTGTPAVAVALQVAWSLVLLWTGSFEQLLIYASVGLSLFSLLTVASVYKLRRSRPDLPRPFRTPGYPVTPAIYLVVTGLLTLEAFRHSPQASLYALASILVGVPVYLLIPRRPAEFGTVADETPASQ